MSMTDLRARILARTASERSRWALILDPGVKAGLDEATLKRDNAAKAHRDRIAEIHAGVAVVGDIRHALAGVNPADETAAALADAEKALESWQDSADAQSVVLVFRRLDPDAYQELVEENIKDGALDSAGFHEALAGACYEAVETAEGEKIDPPLTWPDLKTSALSHGDREAVFNHVREFNRTPAVVPFSPRRSGSRGRAKR